MADQLIRISIGFRGGQVLALRVAATDLERLRGAVGGSGWHELKTEDGSVVIDLANVVYVNLETDEHSVGFS